MELGEDTLKGWGIAVAAVLVAVLGVDYVALQGQRVASGSTSLRADAPPAVLEIHRAGERHLVEITTRRRVAGEMVGQTIEYRLTSPHGRVIHEDSERWSHQRRAFEFRPDEPGAYTLEAHEKTLPGSRDGTARVQVIVGDRQVLSRWLRF